MHLIFIYQMFVNLLDLTVHAYASKICKKMTTTFTCFYFSICILHHLTFLCSLQIYSGLNEQIHSRILKCRTRAYNGKIYLLTKIEIFLGHLTQCPLKERRNLIMAKKI